MPLAARSPPPGPCTTGKPFPSVYAVCRPWLLSALREQTQRHRSRPSRGPPVGISSKSDRPPWWFFSLFASIVSIVISGPSNRLHPWSAVVSFRRPTKSKTVFFRTKLLLFSEALHKEVPRLHQHPLASLRGRGKAGHHQPPRHTGEQQPALR